MPRDRSPVAPQARLQEVPPLTPMGEKIRTQVWDRFVGIVGARPAQFQIPCSTLGTLNKQDANPGITPMAVSSSFALPPMLLPRLAAAFSASGTPLDFAFPQTIRWENSTIRIQSNGAVSFQGDETGRERLREALAWVFSDFASAIGTDEVGLSDPVGPIVVCGVLVPPGCIPELLCSGVRDSKKLSEEEVKMLARKIEKAVHSSRYVILEPAQLNGWDSETTALEVAKAHSEVVGALLADRTSGGTLVVRLGLSRRNIYSEVIEQAPWRRTARVELYPQAEKWPEVAAASVLARNTWLEWVAEVSTRFGVSLRSLTIEEMASHPNAQSLFKMRHVSAIIRKPRPSGMFSIRSYARTDREQLHRALLGLRRFYPTIDRWVEGGANRKGILDRIESGEALCWVASAGGELAGFAIVTPRAPRIAKLSTFYIYPKFRRRAIGSQLLNRVINIATDKGIERLYVTLAAEERNFFIPFLRDFGFLVDGIHPQRYRRNSYEIVMGRTSVSAVVPPAHFVDFIRRYLFELRGFEVAPVSGTRFLAHSKLQLPGLFGVQQPERYLVECYLDSDLKPGTARVLVQEASESGAHGILVCLHGLKQKPRKKGLTILDAYDLETLFYPLRLDRDPDPAWIVPIRPDFADQLIPAWGQATLDAVKVQLSTRNVYYRVADRVDDLRRGATLLWYVSGEAQIRGESKLAAWHVGSPRDLARGVGHLGAWTVERIEQHVGRGNPALALEFDWYKEYASPVSIDVLRELVPKFNPLTMFGIRESEARELRRLGTRQELPSYSP